MYGAKSISILFGLCIALLGCENIAENTSHGSSEKKIVAFSFKGIDSINEIDSMLHRIYIKVPFGTLTSSMVPTIDYVGAGIVPDANNSQDFSKEVLYTVRAEDGSKGSYWIIVNVLNEINTIEQFLGKHFGVCDTSIGDTFFYFGVVENRSISFPEDYDIRVSYDLAWFNTLKSSILVTDEENRIVCNELREHQNKLATYAMNMFPGKKFKGQYYYSWFTYPNLRLDLNVVRYYSWKNYTSTPLLSSNYWDASITNFSWTPEFDYRLAR